MTKKIVQTIIDYKKEFFFCDVATFLYVSSLISHKLGYGFDAMYCRITFILMVAFFAFKIYSDLKNGINRKIVGIHFLSLTIFWVYAFSSIFWANSVDFVLDFNFNYVIQIMFSAILLYYRINDRDDWIAILNILLLSFVYMLVLMIIRVPIDGWGDERLGEAVGLHPNGFGRNLALGAIKASSHSSLPAFYYSILFVP